MKPTSPAAELRAWRVAQTTANPRAEHLTQAEAELWYGLWNGGRTWKRWEAGDSPVPEPLLKRIRSGVKVDHDEAEGYAAQVFERTLSPGQKGALRSLLDASHRGQRPIFLPHGVWIVPEFNRHPQMVFHGSTMRTFADRWIISKFAQLGDSTIYCLTKTGHALAERVQAAEKKRRRQSKPITRR